MLSSYQPRYWLLPVAMALTIVVLLLGSLYARSLETTCTEAVLVQHLVATARPAMGPHEQAFWVRVITEAATEAGISPALFAAVLEVENNFNGKGVSSTGALGAGQVMPKQWLGKPQCDKGTNLQEIEPNLRCAARILRYELDESKGDVQMALRRYNNGPHGQHKVQHYADQTQLKLARAQFARCAPFVKQ